MDAWICFFQECTRETEDMGDLMDRECNVLALVLCDQYVK